MLCEIIWNLCGIKWGFSKVVVSRRIDRDDLRKVFLVGEGVIS